MNPMALKYPHAAKVIDHLWPPLPNEPRPWRERWSDPDDPDGQRLDDMNYQMEKCEQCHGMADCTHDNAPQGDSTLEVGVRQVWQPRQVAMMTANRVVDPEYWEISPDGKYGRRIVLVGHALPCKYAKARTDYVRNETRADNAHIPKIYRSSTLNNFEHIPPDPPDHQGSQHVVVAAEQYIQKKQYMDGRWMFLGGSVGAGKTHIASAIANAARESGHKVAFLKASEVLGEDGTEGNEYGKAAWNLALNADLTIIDELGREYLGNGGNSWQTRQMNSFIDSVYLRDRGLVMNGNLLIHEFEERFAENYSDMAYSRMMERTIKLEMVFPDYRQRLNNSQ
jgi:DNA replication protein DnaC